jgi:hypothetical protein
MRVLVGLACRALGDDDTAAVQLDAGDQARRGAAARANVKYGSAITRGAPRAL